MARSTTRRRSTTTFEEIVTAFSRSTVSGRLCGSLSPIDQHVWTIAKIAKEHHLVPEVLDYLQFFYCAIADDNNWRTQNLSCINHRDIILSGYIPVSFHIQCCHYNYSQDNTFKWLHLKMTIKNPSVMYTKTNRLIQNLACSHKSN